MSGRAGWVVSLSFLVACGEGMPQSTESALESPGAYSGLLTHSPMDIADVSVFVPMGLMVGGHVTPADHAYFYPKKLTPVRAAADGKIIKIQHRVGTPEPNAPYHDDYQLILEISPTLRLYYDLVTQLDEKILAEVGGSVKAGPALNTKIPVQGGQAIGKVEKQSLDFAVIDTKTTLSGFVNPASYATTADKLHTADLFDYYDEPLRGQMIALNPRTALPRGGKIDYDIPGKLVGNWFLEGTNGYAGKPPNYWTGHLAVVYHHIDPSKIEVSIGDWAGQPKQFWVVGNGPDPATIEEKSGPVRYELVMVGLTGDGKVFDSPDLAQVQGVILVQVLAGNKLKVETFPGMAGSSVPGFTAAAKTYVR